MALPLGKLTLLVGAGFVGSVLANEGGASGIRDILSGAFKIVIKGISQDDKPTKPVKSHSDSLLAQVNNLRQELQMLASNRPMTIVTTTTGSGTSKYGVIVLVAVTGYGYIWWKGWKLPDLMFATRRSLSDACTTIAKQLDSVYASISAAKRQLSSKVDRLDSNLDECTQLTAATRDTVSDISAEMERIGFNVTSVRNAVESLETKMITIEGKQNITNVGILKLCDIASTLENRNAVRVQSLPGNSSSRASIEAPPLTPSSKDNDGAAEIKDAPGSREPSMGLQSPEHLSSNGSSVHEPLSKRPSGGSASLFRRTSNITSTLLQQVLSSRQPY
ncbi:hypothetical protein MLD38_002409 [Melastoma candidum]|uniref:Uncharacterized protein n=1 Tax=Melastoma candidum TaxID=119954 RepID=A0ACB9RYG4_9MYRT|nr:hypothetical protein MLD38_002409 [Melastoma candidum]